MNSRRHLVRYVNHVSPLAVMLLTLANSSYSQDSTRYVPNGTEGEVMPTIDKRTTDEPSKKKWNTFNLGFTTLTIGGGFLIDYAGYLQDADGNKQMDSANVELDPGFFVRDTRIMVGGKFKTKRTITWKAGFMYDGQLDAWFLRETGIMVAIPELWGHFFVGRTKEGFSQSKVQIGYAGELVERHLALDPIPILADGVKWLGFLPKQHVFWNIGVYTDWISKNESFSTYKSQFVARIGWLPIYSEPDKTNLHIAFNIRLAHPDDDNVRLRSRPEVGTRAPYFIDTGEFPTAKSTHLGGELYYSSAPWFFGSEYFWHKFNSTEINNPVFNGGEFVVGYLFTGESHPYNAVSSIYGFVQVNKSVFKGGAGAWEALLRFSSFDLNDGVIQGGKFWRISPQVNWYLSQNVRFELMYGYGVLDRFNIRGTTQFFQSRLQLSF